MENTPMEINEFELRKFVAPEFIFGIDARKLAGRYARNYGARKVLLVSDAGVVASGLTEDVCACLRDEGLEYTLYSSISSNPRSDEVNAGAELFRRERCNAIVAVGGGSPMDCAKAIGIVSSNDKDVIEFEGVDRVDIPGPPLICVPTTAGSSADVSQFAIITDESRKTKIAIISKMVVPDVALIDPLTTISMPARLTVLTALDAFCHAVEAYVSTASSPITDLHALEAIRLISANLVQVLADPGNVVLRARIMLASLNAGLAFSNASLGAVHALAHGLGGQLGVDHGECNAILLPHVIEFNYDTVPDRYRQVGIAMGLDSVEMAPDRALTSLVAALRRLNGATGVVSALGQAGVRMSDIPGLVEKAINDPCIFTNPRQPSRQELETIYAKAI